MRMRPSFCFAVRTGGDVAPGQREPSAFLNFSAGYGQLFKMMHWCNWFDFLMKLQKLWRLEAKKTRMWPSRLTSSWTICWAVSFGGKAEQWVTEGQTQLIKPLLFCSFSDLRSNVTRGTLQHTASHWKAIKWTIIFNCSRDFCAHRGESGVSLELCRSPPDEWEPNIDLLLGSLSLVHFLLREHICVSGCSMFKSHFSLALCCSTWDR